ncbi:MAG: hypothetical protein HWE23_03040 [Rhodobacteraceae bacterium]|nr:hypothetical protein [Paracoccaceae bacterium]
MFVAQSAAAVGDDPYFVICASLSTDGVTKTGNHSELAADFHCPLGGVTSGVSLPTALRTVDLGPAFALKLAPDRTGPPEERV